MALLTTAKSIEKRHFWVDGRERLNRRLPAPLETPWAKPGPNESFESKGREIFNSLAISSTIAVKSDSFIFFMVNLRVVFRLKQGEQTRGRSGGTA